MKLQTWIVYNKIEGIKTDIGKVKTTVDATKKQAFDKAWKKFVGLYTFTIGWSLHVRKGRIEEED